MAEESKMAQLAKDGPGVAWAVVAISGAVMLALIFIGIGWEEIMRALAAGIAKFYSTIGTWVNSMNTKAVGELFRQFIIGLLALVGIIWLAVVAFKKKDPDPPAH